MGGADFVVSQLLSSQSLLFKFAYKLTLDKEDAKDLLQETVLRILDNKSRFVVGTNFKGWSMIIMRNIFINHCRRTNKLKIDSNEEVGTEASAVNKVSTQTPETSYSENEIMDKIDEFPGECKESFKLYLIGYSYREIAEKLALPLGTVKSRIFTARSWLKSALEGYVV